MCPACQRITRVQQNPEELKRIRREVKASFFFVTFMAGCFSVGLPLYISGQNANLGVLLFGALLTFTLGLCATVFALTEFRIAAWFAIFIEACC